ncbi:MAG: SDR family oxidoreductase [Thermoplasmatota archaeon]
MELSLKGRNALVCGASAGIGRAAALELAKLGASVTILARDRRRLTTVVKQLRLAGAPHAHALRGDLDKRPEVRQAVIDHMEEHGPIHILVNNAGGPASGPLAEAKEAEMVAAYGRHVLASHMLMQLALPGMREAGFGRIVNVLSTSVREPIPGLGVSGIVRSAMASWAKTLSRELPPGVTINSVLPGYTATERLTVLAQQTAKRQAKTADEVEKSWIQVTPEGRLGKPEELGAAIAFLCSPAASFVRGIVLPVDGGRLNSI